MEGNETKAIADGALKLLQLNLANLSKNNALKPGKIVDVFVPMQCGHPSDFPCCDNVEEKKEKEVYIDKLKISYPNGGHTFPFQVIEVSKDGECTIGFNNQKSDCPKFKKVVEEIAKQSGIMMS